jgi:CRP-like cAMP-binding protein
VFTTHVTGEIALLTRERRTATCRAADFCELWSLSRADLQIVLEDYPELAGKLQQHARERLKQSMRQAKERATSQMLSQSSCHNLAKAESSRSLSADEEGQMVAYQRASERPISRH